MLLSITTRASAQMRQCPGAAGGTAYKVLVDEVQYAKGTVAKPLFPVELMQSAVEGALEKVRRNVLRGTQPSFVYLTCQGRHPAAASDFDHALVRSMTENHAILEIWGTLFYLGTDQYTLDFHYLMVPLASDDASAPLSVALTKAQSAREPEPAQVLGAFTAARAALPIYFALSAGAQAYSDSRFDDATRLLCEAAARARPRADLAGITAYAVDLASRAAQQARSRNPDASGLALLSDAEAKNYCGFATGR